MSSNQVIVGADDTLYALSKSDGSEVWSYKPERDETIRAVEIDSDGDAYFVTENGLAGALDDTGTVLWENDGNISNNGKLYELTLNYEFLYVINESDSVIYAIDKSRGVIEITKTDVLDFERRDFSVEAASNFNSDHCLWVSQSVDGPETTEMYVQKLSKGLNDLGEIQVDSSNASAGSAVSPSGQNLFAKDTGGEVRLYDSSTGVEDFGSYPKTLGGGLLTNADANGNLVFADFNEGEVEVFDDNGSQQFRITGFNNLRGANVTTRFGTFGPEIVAADIDSSDNGIIMMFNEVGAMWQSSANVGQINSNLVIKGNFPVAYFNETETVTASQATTSSSMNSTLKLLKIDSAQVQTPATMLSPVENYSIKTTPTVSTSASMLKGFVTPITSEQTSTSVTMLTAQTLDLKDTIQANVSAGMNDATVTSVSVGADSVFSPATINTLPPVDESISGTQASAQTTMNIIPVLDEFLDSTQVQSVSSENDAFVSNFLRATPLSVFATENDALIGDYNRTVQQQAQVSATMNESPLNRDTTGLGGTFWKIEQGDFTEILIDGVAVDGGWPDFTVGKETEVEVVLTRDGHITDYDTLREYGEFLSDVSHSVGTDYQQRPYYGERIHPDATFNSTLWKLEPGPGISEAEAWWVIVRGVDDNVNIGGTGGTMTLNLFVISPNSETPRGIIESRYEVQG